MSPNLVKILCKFLSISETKAKTIIDTLSEHGFWQRQMNYEHILTEGDVVEFVLDMRRRLIIQDSSIKDILPEAIIKTFESNTLLAPETKLELSSLHLPTSVEKLARTSATSSQPSVVISSTTFTHAQTSQLCSPFLDNCEPKKNPFDNLCMQT